MVAPLPVVDQRVGYGHLGAVLCNTIATYAASLRLHGRHCGTKSLALTLQHARFILGAADMSTLCGVDRW